MVPSRPFVDWMNHFPMTVFEHNPPVCIQSGRNESPFQEIHEKSRNILYLLYLHRKLLKVDPEIEEEERRINGNVFERKVLTGSPIMIENPFNIGKKAGGADREGLAFRTRKGAPSFTSQKISEGLIIHLSYSK